MKIDIKTDTRRASPYPVCIYLCHARKTRLIATGMHTSTPLQGFGFPATERNAAAKTKRLAEIYDKCEKWIIDNPFATLEDAAAAVRFIITGKEKRGESLHALTLTYADSCSNAGTASLYRMTAAHIASYDAAATLESLSREWLQGFDAHLAATKSVNGRAIDLRNLRAVVNRAITDGKTQNYPFRAFRIKHEATAHRTLTEGELAALLDFKGEEWAETYRDLFFLSLYLAGINATDLLTLQASSVRGGRLQYRRRKTGHLFNLIVPQQAAKILRKYKGKGGYLLPFLAGKASTPADFRKRWNKALKKIGGFTTSGRGGKRTYTPVCPHLTTYYARHTWATIAARLGISRDTIALCLGHSWADVTSIYIAPDHTACDKAVLAVAAYVEKLKR